MQETVTHSDLIFLPIYGALIGFFGTVIGQIIANYFNVKRDNRIQKKQLHSECFQLYSRAELLSLKYDPKRKDEMGLEEINFLDLQMHQILFDAIKVDSFLILTQPNFVNKHGSFRNALSEYMQSTLQYFRFSNTEDYKIAQKKISKIATLFLNQLSK